MFSAWGSRLRLTVGAGAAGPGAHCFGVAERPAKAARCSSVRSCVLPTRTLLWRSKPRRRPCCTNRAVYNSSPDWHQQVHSVDLASNWAPLARPGTGALLLTCPSPRSPSSAHNPAAELTATSLTLQLRILLPARPAPPSTVTQRLSAAHDRARARARATQPWRIRCAPRLGRPCPAARRSPRRAEAAHALQLRPRTALTARARAGAQTLLRMLLLRRRTPLRATLARAQPACMPGRPCQERCGVTRG